MNDNFGKPENPKPPKGSIESITDNLNERMSELGAPNISFDKRERNIREFKAWAKKLKPKSNVDLNKAGGAFKFVDVVASKAFELCEANNSQDSDSHKTLLMMAEHLSDIQMVLMNVLSKKWNIEFLGKHEIN